VITIWLEWLYRHITLGVRPETYPLTTVSCMFNQVDIRNGMNRFLLNHYRFLLLTTVSCRMVVQGTVETGQETGVPFLMSTCGNDQETVVGGYISGD
jgi:hypothetical protein